MQTTAKRCDICGCKTLDENPKGWIQVSVCKWTINIDGDICDGCAKRPFTVNELMTLLATNEEQRLAAQVRG